VTQSCAVAETMVLRLANHTVVVDKGLVTVDSGMASRLPERERVLLEALAERPGVVVSKRALLRRVWGPGETDEHVVEVTIARLRQRLGVAGVGIETVIRRGYRLSTPSPLPS
jgi:uroporphyrinogen-III synthase